MNELRFKIVICIGTRPEAIKMAPVYLELLGDERFQPLLVSTGQHREMLQQVFNVFDIRPDVNLDVMKHNQTLPQIQAHKLCILLQLVFDHEH